MLAAPGGKDNVMNTLGKSDPLIHDALLTITNRKDFVKTPPALSNPSSIKADNKVSWTFNAPVENDPKIVDELINRIQMSLQVLKKDIELKSGTALLDFIVNDLEGMKKLLFDSLTMSVIMCAVTAPSWLNEKIYEWLGEKNAADTIAQSVANNITSEMGLALMDVADIIRPYSNIVEYLQQVKDDNFLEGLLSFENGQNTKDAIEEFLDRYGMRCSGEIDISKSRWSEKPAALVPMILTNVRNFQRGAGSRKFEQGKQEALNKENELLDRLQDLPDGDEKVRETKRVIDLIRNFSGFREYPKYGIVSRYYIYKQALLKEAAQLLEANVIHDKDDLYYLTFQELKEVIQTGKADFGLIAKRKGEFKYFEKLSPPRLITSDGEIITGSYMREDIPTNALVGLAVSSGIVEGRARIILNIDEADLEDGDILVTTFTDPSWTPLFVSIKGLVTEVGGIMTHGAVIAREYGLPAVVCVENATHLIKEGRRIRVNGGDGYVEIV